MGRHVKTKNRKGLKITGAILASTLVCGGTTAGYMYWNLNQRIQSNSVDIAVANDVQQSVIESKPEEVPEFAGAFSVLLVGNDDGNGDAKYGNRDHALNDVNILLRVSADHTKATAISVPRDMFVDAPVCTDPETGVQQPAVKGIKINQSLSRGGLKCVVDTFRQMTGETIDYAAMIQFDGVIALSNAVGGVPVCTTTDIDDPESGLKLAAGNNTIQGEQALAFLRTRHGVGDGSDLARISNQQVFLSSLMKTLKSKETLTDPTKIYGIANVAADNMTLSSNLASIPTLASLASSLKNIPLEDITFIQYPTSYLDVNGASGVVPKKEAAAEMLEAVFSDKSITLTGGTAPGSIGAVEEEPTQTSSASPSPTPTATPSPSATPTTITSTPADSETPVALSADVTGMTASQNTCSRGFGDY
jgi:LCP family protein required for cell wall assembly